MTLSQLDLLQLPEGLLGKKATPLTTQHAHNTHVMCPQRARSVDFLACVHRDPYFRMIRAGGYARE
jgi:hypothetical protein